MRSVPTESTTGPLEPWAAEAAVRLADLGFLLVDGDYAGAVGRPRLLVALRDQPTLRHFDPEAVSYWWFDHDHGKLNWLDRNRRMPVERTISWGRIQVVDRIPVSNQFLTFGGTLRARAVDASTIVCTISSPAPILRWSGHSQGTDLLTDEVGAFLARLRIPIDYMLGAEERVGRVSPRALYSAMLAESLPRLRRSSSLRRVQRGYARFAESEAVRLKRDAPDDWREGEALLDDLGLRGL
jgi:hypothetical protein